MERAFVHQSAFVCLCLGVMILRFLHEQGNDEEAEFKGHDDDVEGGDMAERRRQEAHERAREEREEVARSADDAGREANLARADAVLGDRVAKHVDGVQADAHEAADDVEDGGGLRDDVENQEGAEGVESREEDDGRLAAEAVGEEAEDDAAESADAVDGAEEGASFRRAEPLVRHEEVRAHRGKAPVRDDVENLDEDAEPDDFVEADGADGFDEMDALDVRRGIRVFLLEAEDQQQAEDDGDEAHVRQADAPVARALKAPSVIRRADVGADGVEGHHEAVEHGACRWENGAGDGVHDDVPAAFKNAEADAPEGCAGEACGGRDAGGHAAEADHAENQHALAAEAVSKITGRDIDECLAERKDGANRSELYGGQRKRGCDCLEADAEGKAVGRVEGIAECQQEQLEPKDFWYLERVLLLHNTYVPSKNKCMMKNRKDCFVL